MEGLSVVVWKATKEMDWSVLVKCAMQLLVTLLVIYGYYLTYTDIDECAMGTDKCDQNADCVNTEGSYQCMCRAGYEGNGRLCTGTH